MFKLTSLTDPKTVMFEGFPDVPIGRIELAPKDHYGRAEPARYYVFIGGVEAERYNFGGVPLRKGYNHAYDDAGSDMSKRWPRLVLRIVLDSAKPITATDSGGCKHRYVLDGIFTPADGSEPILHVSAPDRRGSVPLQILASTGKVMGGAGSAGSALTFSNDPIIEKTSRRVTLDGLSYPVTVTTTDGIVTNIEWKPA